MGTPGTPCSTAISATHSKCATISAMDLRWEPFSSMTLGRRLRMVLRFAHTGEGVGLAGQTVAGLVSAGASALVYTGLALTWRRAWQVRRRYQELVETAMEIQSPDQESGPLSPQHPAGPRI